MKGGMARSVLGGLPSCCERCGALAAVVRESVAGEEDESESESEAEDEDDALASPSCSFEIKSISSALAAARLTAEKPAP